MLGDIKYNMQEAEHHTESRQCYFSSSLCRS